jgi:hypothetical protein
MASSTAHRSENRNGQVSRQTFDKLAAKVERAEFVKFVEASSHFGQAIAYPIRNRCEGETCRAFKATIRCFCCLADAQVETRTDS